MHRSEPTIRHGAGRRLLLASLFALSAAPARAGGGTWTVHAPLDQARQEVGAARIGGRVYVVGGLLPGPGLNATASVEAYDLATDSWSFVAPLPVALDHMAVAAWDGRLFVMGGFSGDFQARDETWIYAPASDSWSAGAPLPAARGACWSVTHGARIYLFGGDDALGQARASTFVYDPVTDSWSSGADMPTAREHLNAVAFGAHVYVLGGRSGGAFAVNERYDPLADRWETLAPMPTARSAMGVAVFAGRIFAIGGEVPMLFDRNEVYDPATDSWSTQAPMPLARHGVAAVTLDDRIFLPAGGTVQGLAPTAHADSFQPEPIPGLARDCFCDAGAPCANADAGAGCATSSGAGAELSGSGSASVAADDLLLTASGAPANQSGLVFMGPLAITLPFGDGLRCVGAGATGIFRFRVQNAGARGVLVEGPGIVARSQGFAPGGAIQAGDTWRFQGWFRDPGGPCGSGFNTTNAVEVAFRG